MKIRKLKLTDAPLMYEWMQDEDITENFQVNFTKKTLSDCEKFIMDSQIDQTNVYMAITDDQDVYMGTVSLKNIDKENHSAEFAIVLRGAALGKGFSGYAMKKIMELGFGTMHLEKIYWSVLKKNKRAIRFYDKQGYHRAANNDLPFIQTEAETGLWWYICTNRTQEWSFV